MILQVVTVSIEGAQPDTQRDVESANTVWSGECELWVEVVSNVVVDRPDLLVLSQTDCLVSGHVVSEEEDELFNLGRGLGTDVVGYYLRGDTGGFRGCAAHPADRRGFWVGDNATQWTWIHEMTHVVGRNLHVTHTDNLMFRATDSITNPPPDLNGEQCARIVNDPALLCIPSIVLNL